MDQFHSGNKFKRTNDHKKLLIKANVLKLSSALIEVHHHNNQHINNRIVTTKSQLIPYNI